MEQCNQESLHAKYTPVRGAYVSDKCYETGKPGRVRHEPGPTSGAEHGEPAGAGRPLARSHT